MRIQNLILTFLRTKQDLLNDEVAEKKFLIDGIKHDIRDDGRARLDFRPFELESAELVYTSTSTKILIGRTEILISVRIEMCSEEQMTLHPDTGALTTSLVCCRHAFPNLDFHSLEALSDQYSAAFAAILRHTDVMDMAQLLIQRGRFAWNVCVDAMVLSNGGNIVDAAVLGAYHSLNQLRIPQTTLKKNRRGEPDFEISEDPSTFKPLSGVEDLPVSVTFRIFGNYFIVDPTTTEEMCGTCELRVVVFPDDSLSVCQSGAGFVSPSHLLSIADQGKFIGQRLLRTLDVRR